MTTTTYHAVRVDEENNAELWWAELDAAYPEIAKSLRRNGCAVFHSGPGQVWDKLAALPGFSDGPEHARDALIDCGSEGEQWASVTAQRHQQFDEAI